METLVTILGILSVVIAFIFTITVVTEKRKLTNIIGIISIIIFTLFITFSIITSKKNSQYIEFSSSKYELSYKYIIEDNHIDTIYVIKKIKS